MMIDDVCTLAIGPMTRISDKVVRSLSLNFLPDAQFQLIRSFTLQIGSDMFLVAARRDCN